jgi:hypothetical protein
VPLFHFSGRNVFLSFAKIRTFSVTYLLTPPVAVENNENQVFYAKKTSDDDSGMGFNFDLKAIMGFTDTLFVVERSVYGKNQWVRVADFTTTLNDKSSQPHLVVFS